jgi:oligopeptide/dipeptide ABC transporter ATP-binding protein
VVRGLSLDIYPNEVLCLVGESGCGKSITALSIMRLLPTPPVRVRGGKIRFRGEDLLRLSGRRMRSIRADSISMIFQDPLTSLDPVFTVGDVIVEVIRAHREVSKEEARQLAGDALTKVGLPDPISQLDSYPHQLSGGMRQRVMIAMALVLDPDILIADEPTTALDVTTQAQILDLLREIQERTQMSVIIITHDMGVIAEMADDVIVMYLGRVVESGPVDEIFHQPKHPYTQALLRSIPSIFAEPRSKLPTIAGSIPHPHNRPSGCPFHPRCSEFMPDKCDAYVPQLRPISPSQRTSCFLYHDPEGAPRA